MKSLRSQILTIATVVITSAYASAIPAVAQTTNAPTPRRGVEVEQVSDLHPFTHIAYIPADADLSTIRIDSVKMVKVARCRMSATATIGQGIRQTVLARGTNLGSPH